MGVGEMDILAIRPLPNGGHDCRHLEVTLSINPISYISKVPKEIQKQSHKSPNNAKKRDEAELRQGVAEWIASKFDDKGKAELRQRLCPGNWSRELVLNVVKHQEEIALFKEAGIEVRFLTWMLSEMGRRDNVIQAAAGADLFNLVQLRKGDA